MLKGFAPIASAASSLLILGTGPSVRSLELQQYYGHPRNAFWPIMGDILEGEIGSYEQKRNLLLFSGIALWDVLASFERSGSLDSAYTTVIPNKLESFLHDHPSITQVFFNGKTAQQLYRRYIGFFPGTIRFATLPSTSPAYTLSYEQKRDAWDEALKIMPSITLCPPFCLE